LSTEFEKALKKWAEEKLKNIGISKNKISGFEELQDKVIENLRDVYSDKVIKLFLMPANFKKIQSPSGFARITDPCGDTMEIFFMVKNKRIARAAFWTDGCESAIASGGMVVELAKGRSVKKAGKIIQKDILDAMGGLPKETLHCALLAADTLKEAVGDYALKRNSKELKGKKLN